MALKLYLAARPAAGLQSYGHLFLILWDDVTETGFTIGGNQTGIPMGTGKLHLYVISTAPASDSFLGIPKKSQTPRPLV